MINDTAILEKLEKINISQKEIDITDKLAEVLTVLKTQNY
jgi:hypothetical protein